jgi:ATP-binding cassette subfamily F protein 3
MISTDRLSISFGGRYLFREISFLVNSNDKIGLVGRNGAGKTTLFVPLWVCISPMKEE